MAALLWQADDPSIYGFEAPQQGTPVNSDTYAIPINARHPGTALLFIDYMLRPENVEKNINYIGYPMPVHGTEATYQEIVADYPECTVTVDGPGPRPLLHQRQRRQDPGPRRGVHRNEGRTMTTTTGAHGVAAAAPGAQGAPVDLDAGARHGMDVGVLRLRAAAAHRPVLRHHRRAGQPALRQHAGQHHRHLQPHLPAGDHPQPGVRRCGVGDLPADRLPGRLCDRAARRPLQERSGGAARGAVLRQLPGADVRLADPAVRREHADDLAARPRRVRELPHPRHRGPP